MSQYPAFICEGSKPTVVRWVLHLHSGKGPSSHKKPHWDHRERWHIFRIVASIVWLASIGVIVHLQPEKEWGELFLRMQRSVSVNGYRDLAFCVDFSFSRDNVEMLMMMIINLYEPSSFCLGHYVLTLSLIFTTVWWLAWSFAVDSRGDSVLHVFACTFISRCAIG